MVKRVTGKDVAARAGVTAATVSYVLSGTAKRSVSKETRERVLLAARELGYVPDKTAKSLRRRETKTIGVAIDKNLATPRYALALQGMSQTASSMGYRLLLCHTGSGENGMADYLNVFLERQVDGVIYVGADNIGPNQDDIETVERDGIPFVALDCQLNNPSLGSVDFDYRAGAREATSLLISKRSSRVAYIRPAFESRQESLREQGVIDACRDAGIEPPLTIVAPIGAEALTSFDRDPYDDHVGEPSSAHARLIELPLSRLVNDGDLIVCSWAGWSGIVRVATGFTLSLYADLANDLYSAFNANCYCVMPNYQAGKACVEQLVRQINGGPAAAKLLPIPAAQSYLLHLHDN